MKSDNDLMMQAFQNALSAVCSQPINFIDVTQLSSLIKSHKNYDTSLDKIITMIEKWENDYNCIDAKKIDFDILDSEIQCINEKISFAICPVNNLIVWNYGLFSYSEKDVHQCKINQKNINFLMNKLFII